MRASELLGLTEARVRYSKSANSEGRVARIGDQPITLRVLHNMRIQRDRRNAELAAQSEFVKRMYGPRPGDDQTKRPNHTPIVPRASDRARKPRASSSAASSDAAKDDNGSAS